MQMEDWAVTFKEVYDRAVKSYQQGSQNPNAVFSPEEKRFLASIGCTSQELFDFVEDWVRMGEPSYENVLLVTALRRSYFSLVQRGQSSGKTISMSSLPRKDAAIEGIAWLPRIIVKARAKLRGEMPPELMYGCGGDRPFLQGVNIDLADFLLCVWLAGDDDQKIIDFVKFRAAKRA